jgi:hypothetical protein
VNWLSTPAWTTSEWASVLSTGFAAVAAAASWVTIIFDRRRQREARRPTVSAGFGVTPTNVASIRFVNGGPGLAVRLSHFGVLPGGFKYGGLVGTGFLGPGGEAVAPVQFLVERKGKSEFVWFCTDVDNNVHLWAYDGRYECISARKYLSGKAPKKPSDYFRRMYPDVEIPEKDAPEQDAPEQKA